MQADDKCLVCGTTRSESHEKSMGMYCEGSENGMHRFAESSIVEELQEAEVAMKDNPTNSEVMHWARTSSEAHKSAKRLEAGARYVVGFVFDLNAHLTLLMRKNRPDFQAGKLNGPGGKVEDGDVAKFSPLVSSAQIAMAREWLEEVHGPEILPEDWTEFCSIEDERGWSVTYLYANAVDLHECHGRTDESVEIAPYKHLEVYDVLPNVLWLVPMALSLHLKHPLSKFTDRAKRFVVEEKI